MEPFYTRFPSVAMAETLSLVSPPGREVPEDTYRFIEHFCSERGCNCRRVSFAVFGERTGQKIHALISYGWETKAFYAKWSGERIGAFDYQGPYFDHAHPHPEYAQVFMDTLKEAIKNKEFLKQLKRHYTMFRGTVR